ncbi:hypothetical protein GQ53DRAFT_802508 [Thozetella sp. PMI_491]|nr:hypothetical protein GQ53DRAFT_802508 [Thozetella sp. PMI_491]
MYQAMNLVGVKLVIEDCQRKKAKAARDRQNVKARRGSLVGEEDHANRQRFYLAKRYKAISARAAELGREEEEVILPLEWEPPGERLLPPTPWMVDEEALEQAIAEFEDRKAGEDMEDKEEEEADDIEEVVVTSSKISAKLLGVYNVICVEYMRHAI